MSEPIVEQIAQDIADTLADLTIENDYDIDLVVIREAISHFAEFTPADGVVMISQGDTKQADAALFRRHWMTTWTVSIYCQPPDDDSPIATLINTRAADLVKALMTDQTRGGLARTTTPTQISHFITPAAFCGADITIEIEYTTQENDIYTGA